jgi:hypothetical protein
MSPDNPEQFAQLVFDAARDGKWLSLLALGLIGLVWAIRKFAAPKVPFFGTGEGGAVVNFGTGFLLALATAILAGSPPSWAMAWVSLQTSFLAAGGWSLFKSLIPLLVRLVPGFGAGNAAASIATAKKEGEAAAAETKPKTAADIINGPETK